MPNRIDISAQRFGLLIVLKFSHSEQRNDGRGSYSFWFCQCDCRNKIIARADNLRSGNTISCGCVRKTNIKHGHARGARPTVEYRTWQRIHARCSNPNHISFERYGARGIKVCERWSTFENFLADIGPRPKGRYSIERIDNDGDYEPINCCWLPLIDQASNRRQRRWWKRPSEV